MCSPRPGSPASRTAPAPRSCSNAGPAPSCTCDCGSCSSARRSVHDTDGRPVDELVDGDDRHFPWEEGVPREVDAERPRRRAAASTPCPFALPAEHTSERVTGGRVERRCLPLTGRLVVAAEPLPGPYDVLRLRIDVVNDSACPDGAPREVALRTSLIAAHTLVAVTAGAFLSRPTRREWALPATRALDNRHTWPVLAGPEGRSDLLLSSPIILADHPQLAPESPTNLFDGTEIDEILSLRTLVLTEEEKAEARATDPRAAAVVDAVDAMPPEIWERLHGAIRTVRPRRRPARGRQARRTTSSASGTTPSSRPTCRGGIRAPTPPSIPRPTPSSSAARRSPRAARCCCGPARGGDAQDRFLDGLPATVHAVLHDVDGEVHVAVSVDDDPAAELQVAHGRFRYFHPDEIEVVP